MLHAAADALASGAPAPVLLQGEAGIGKSRLAADVATYAAHADVTIISAAALEYEQQRPFAPLERALALTPDAADPRRARLGALLQPDASASAAQSTLQHQVVEGILELLDDPAPAGTLLIVEDIHWADAATLLVLQRAVAAGAPALVVATRRLHPAGRDVRRFVEAVESAGQVVQLQPLDEAATASLAASTLGRQPEPALLAHLARAGGNPLFVTELLAGAGDQSADGAAALPPTLRSAVLRRLSALDDAAAEAVRIAAVLGASFSVADLAAVLGERPTALLPHLQDAVEAGLLEDAGDHLRFRHDLVRDAVYDDTPHGIRAALHLQIGRTLATAGAPSTVVATHWSLGARPGDEEAVAWLRRAAGDAAPRDPATAATLLDRALRLCPLHAPYRDELAADLVRSLVWSGRFEDAEARALQVLQRHHDPAIGGEIRFFLGRIQIYRGRVAESIATVEQALQEPALPPALRARLVADLALRCGAAGALEAMTRRADEAMAAGVSAADELSISTASSALAWAAALQGQPDVAVEHGQRGLLRGREGEAVQPVQARLYCGIALLSADRLEEAHATLAEARAVAGRLGAAWGEPLATAFLARERYASGSWTEAAALAEQSLQLASETGVSIWAPIAGWIAAAVAVHRGDVRRAEQLVTAAWAQVAGGDGLQLARPAILAVRALVATASGDSDGAIALRRAAWTEAGDMGLRTDQVEVAVALAADAAAGGDATFAAEVAGTATAIVQAMDTPSATAVARMCAALAAGDPAAALAAAEAARHSPRPLLRAEIFEQSLAVLARAGATGNRSRLAQDAAGAYEALGATWDVDRVHATRRQLGLRRAAKAGPRTTQRSGWDALTSSERRVVELVADGLSNPDIAQRLFVSRRTVETHVSHALAKLGVASRVEVAALVAGRRATETPESQ